MTTVTDDHVIACNVVNVTCFLGQNELSRQNIHHAMHHYYRLVYYAVTFISNVGNICDKRDHITGDGLRADVNITMTTT